MVEYLTVLVVSGMGYVKVPLICPPRVVLWAMFICYMTGIPNERLVKKDRGIMQARPAKLYLGRMGYHGQGAQRSGSREKKGG